MPWIAGAPLTSLGKKDMAPRPIAPREASRRLVGSYLPSRANKKAAAYFQPAQIGVAAKSGSETVVHGVRSIANKLGTRSD